MIDFFNIALQLISIDFFIGYALYSFCYLALLPFFKKYKAFQRTDEYANRFIAFTGMLYLILWIAAVISAIIGLDSEETRDQLYNRMFGMYWFGFWLQPFTWIFATQLLRFRNIRRWIALRLILSFVLLLSFERFVIITTSLEREYMDSWEFGIPYPILLLGVILKTGLFICFSYLYGFVESKIKNILWKRSPEQ